MTDPVQSRSTGIDGPWRVTVGYPGSGPWDRIAIEYGPESGGTVICTMNKQMPGALKNAERIVAQHNGVAQGSQEPVAWRYRYRAFRGSRADEWATEVSTDLPDFSVSDLTPLYAAPQPLDPAYSSRGCAAIAAERQRQISKEGWTPHHDDEHTNGEMAIAAALYAIGQTGQDTIVSPIAPHWRGETLLNRLWPWSWDWWKPKDRCGDLVRAGALIAAEIDRLDRASSVSSTEGK